MLECFFNKVAELKVCNVIKERLQQRCFFVNVAELWRLLSILKVICEKMVLIVRLNLSKVCKSSRVWLKFIGKLFLTWLFEWLFLKVQHFQTQLKRRCFFVNLQNSSISEWLLLRLKCQLCLSTWAIYVPLMS